jgi:hypothetical protein
MNWQTRGTWLQGEHPEPETETDTEHELVRIQLPDGTPDWDDSTVYLEQLHEALVAKCWGRGPI